MSTPSIAQQVDDFNVGFESQIGDRLAAVFSEEQSTLRAAGTPTGALAEGDLAPDAELRTADGRTLTFGSLLGEAVTVVVFYRGAWCPYCSITLRTYQQDLLPALEERGAQLVAISPQTADGTAQSQDNGALGFTVLSDPGNVLADGFGIVTEPSGEAQDAHTELGFAVSDSNADDTARVPFPSVYVIDPDGRIRFADIHVDYTSRTEVDDIIAAVDRLDES
ncbi:peroxiredoxin-like family protein [Microbacterium testaceum]|uniref:peroxiredoxin-like family protein n=1 Tax=Microbacterium testaceum TaxID=2033 RepID=UPI001248D021|nr:peroxiredoxin-like family protein [Microbacterium testaceum]